MIALDKLYHKVSRDPVHGEIRLYPLEMVVADTKPVQRLRFLSQLAGAEFVYPGATHTRFVHSLGTMHICGLYSERIFPGDYKRYRVLRLAGLLHDVGHGPYSHQFDEVAFPKAGVERGHDDHRRRIILEYLPKEIEERLSWTGDIRVLNALRDEQELLELSGRDMMDAIFTLLEEVVRVFDGEEEATVEFNIVQGPLGADRLDFVLRDSYFSGTRHFGTGALDRLVAHAAIADDGTERLCYSIKVIDDIYTVLFGRFMMYKNVYFHKTSRAADLMIQKILELSYEPLRFKNRIHDLEAFMELTDQRILNEIEIVFDSAVHRLSNESGAEPDDVKNRLINGDAAMLDLLSEDEKLILQAYIILLRLKRRDLWKLVVERPISTTGVDPAVVSYSVAQDILEKMKRRLKVVLNDTSIPSDERALLEEIYEDFDEIFIVDTPYKLSLMHPEEFTGSGVYLLDENTGKVMSFEDFEKLYPTYRLLSNNLIQLVRIYTRKDVRETLRRYGIVPESKLQITTRW